MLKRWIDVMAKPKYAMNPEEKIVYKVSCVRHGFWGAYTHVLTITNQSVILEKYGLLNNFKGIERYNYSNISQAIQGQASNGEKQLELYVGGKIEDFALQSGNETELRILITAINDQMGADAEYYDYNYYQRLKDTDRISILRAKAHIEELPNDEALNFAEAAAERIIKSGDFSVKGITKAVTKASGKKNNGIFSGMIDSLLDDSGVRDIQDEFTDIGNEFREAFGLPTKITYAERKELEALEEKQRQEEIQYQRNAALQYMAFQQKARINTERDNNSTATQQSVRISKISVKEQMELLQQVKALLDAGVLTQEEFEAKKHEILNS